MVLSATVTTLVVWAFAHTLALSVTAMVKGRNYSVPCILERLLRRLCSILHPLTVNPSNVHADFVVGHATLPNGADLPYNWLARGQSSQAFPKVDIVSTGACNYGWCGKYFVIKLKYLVRTGSQTPPTVRCPPHCKAAVYMYSCRDSSQVQTTALMTTPKSSTSNTLWKKATLMTLSKTLRYCLPALSLSPAAHSSQLNTALCPTGTRYPPTRRRLDVHHRYSYFLSLPQAVLDLHLCLRSQPTEVPVHQVTWMLTPAQELAVCERGITEKPTADVTMDAKMTYTFCAGIMTMVSPDAIEYDNVSGSAFKQVQMRFLAEKMEAIISFYTNVYTPAVGGTTPSLEDYSRLYSTAKNAPTMTIEVIYLLLCLWLCLWLCFASHLLIHFALLHNRNFIPCATPPFISTPQ